MTVPPPDNITSTSPEAPTDVDYAAFGPIQHRPLPRHTQVAAARLARNWATIPHVTHHEEVDITGLDAARAQLSAAGGVKVTPLPYLIAAVAAALRQHPQVNASLAADGRQLIAKQYYHIGFVVETPRGLLVPVVRDADRKSLAEIAREVVATTNDARRAGLPRERMTGGCFTISSLGAAGGTGFTPIINAPELAILGVSRATRRPFESADGLSWRTMLPLSLSYDHRALNGGDAARFVSTLAEQLLVSFQRSSQDCEQAPYADQLSS